jgi:phosphate transport system ATP-binding protein
MAKRIEASNVSSYYGSFKAIDSISMTVEPKTITALIGPSGCGKSTFLRSINRMHEVLPDARIEGRLTIDDQNIYDADVDVTAVRRMIGMVFQRPNPFPTMSIYDNVVAGLKLNGVRKKSCSTTRPSSAQRREPVGRGQGPARTARRRPVRRAAAAAVHRPHHRGRAAGRADGRACSALDPISTLAIEDLMFKLKDRYTIIIVTHNMQQAARVSDRTGFFSIDKTGDPAA